MIINWIYLNKKRIILWFLVGGFIVILSSASLLLLIDILNINIFIATLINGEVTILVRYILNKSFIFKQKNNNDLFYFHLISTSAFFTWFISINILIHFNVPYLFANIIAMLFSISLNFYGNFFIIWKEK